MTGKITACPRDITAGKNGHLADICGAYVVKFITRTTDSNFPRKNMIMPIFDGWIIIYCKVMCVSIVRICHMCVCV